MTLPLPDGDISSVSKVSPRHVFEARIQIRLQRDQRKLSFQAWVRDLSETGLRAFVAETLVVGESVTFEIPLPGSDKQVIPARVARALGTEYGFEFTALSAEQRGRIQSTLKECPAIPPYRPGSMASA